MVERPYNGVVRIRIRNLLVLVHGAQLEPLSSLFEFYLPAAQLIRTFIHRYYHIVKEDIKHQKLGNGSAINLNKLIVRKGEFSQP